MELGYYIYLILLLLIAVAGFIRFNKLSKAFKVLTILILSTLISESIKKVVGKIYHNSMPVGHLWAVIEYCLFSLTYYFLLSGARIKKAIIISLFGMLLLEIITVAVLKPCPANVNEVMANNNILNAALRSCCALHQSLLQFPSLLLNISQFIYVLYSLLLFRQMLLFPAEQSLFKQSLFWFNLNVLFYGTTMFLNFALTSYFIQNKLDMTMLIYFSFAVNFIFYIVIGISILIDNKKVNAFNISNA